MGIRVEGIPRTNNERFFTEAQPCVVMENNSETGKLLLTAYRLFWEDNKNAVLLELSISANRPAVAKFKVGDCVLYQKKDGKDTVTPTEALGKTDIAELKEARAEFLPKMFGN